MTGNASSQYQVQYDAATVCRNATVLVLGLAGSIVLYIIIGTVMVKTRPVAAGATQARIPFFVVAFFLALASLGYRRTQLRWLRLQSVAEVKGASGLIKHLYVTTMISAVLGELIGLIGLTLVLIGGDLEDILSLGIVGLVTVLVGFPRRRAWTQTVAYLDTSDEDEGPEESTA